MLGVFFDKEAMGSDCFERVMIAEFHKYYYLPWEVVTKWAGQAFEEILIILF